MDIFWTSHFLRKPPPDFFIVREILEMGLLSPKPLIVSSHSSSIFPQRVLNLKVPYLSKRLILFGSSVSSECRENRIPYDKHELLYITLILLSAILIGLSYI